MYDTLSSASTSTSFILKYNNNHERKKKKGERNIRVTVEWNMKTLSEIG